LMFGFLIVIGTYLSTKEIHQHYRIIENLNPDLVGDFFCYFPTYACTYFGIRPQNNPGRLVTPFPVEYHNHY
jgi:hypothetical protein